MYFKQKQLRKKLSGNAAVHVVMSYHPFLSRFAHTQLSCYAKFNWRIVLVLLGHRVGDVASVGTNVIGSNPVQKQIFSVNVSTSWKISVSTLVILEQ